MSLSWYYDYFHIHRISAAINEGVHGGLLMPNSMNNARILSLREANYLAHNFSSYIPSRVKLCVKIMTSYVPPFKLFQSACILNK